MLNDTQNQCDQAAYVLSDDEIINQDSPNYSVAGSTNNDDVFTAPHSSITLQKKPEEIQQEVGNIAIQSKQPTQFQHMSNEFEIAYWLAHHKRILDLALNIQNGMMTKTDEGYETHSTSSGSSQSCSSTQQFSFGSVLTPPEIDQVVK